jgi:hypothetical protein
MGEVRPRIIVIPLLALGLLASPAFAADNAIDTVQKLVAFIKSSIQLKQTDQERAAYIKTIRLKEKLEERTVEELQGQGAGTKTVAALHELALRTVGLPPAAPPAPKPVPKVIPPPSSEEQAQILAEIRENAINYTNSLPNYICARVTERKFDPRGGDSWRVADTVQEQLTFFDHEEKLKVISVSGRLITTTIEHNQLGGASSSGEFGTLLYEVFNADTDTDFSWDHWATLRGKRMYVFGYKVRTARSKYTIYHYESRRKIVAGYRGLIYADTDSKQVMRLTLDCEDLPADYPIQQVSLVLDYKPQMISDREFILPYHSDLHSREGQFMVWNETTFRNYRRYSADTSITFDTSDNDPIPQDQLKETPATAKPDEKKQDDKKKTSKQQ